MGRTRSFDNGNITVTFHTEQDAKAFDEYLESTFTVTYGGKEVDSWKVRDRFDPYTFFNIKKQEVC